MSDTQQTHPALKVVHMVEDGTLVAVLMSMILLAVTQIIMRNGFEMSLLWIDPLLRIGVLWIGLLGSMIASRNNDHIAIDLASHYIPENLQRFLTAFISLFTVGICGLVAYHSYEFVMWAYEDGSQMVRGVPDWILQSIIPFAFGVIALRYLVLAALALMNRLPEKAPEIEAIEEELG